MNVTTELKAYSQQFNQAVEAFLPTPSGAEKRVVEAMHYAVANGGKRLRPFLVCKTAELFGLDFKQSLNCAAAIEFLHSYSLIHDDLPAMDNDDLRRGKPTCHKAFDEATAILAGDGLLTYAFDILSQEQTHPDAAVRCQLVAALARGAGAFGGMVAGQMLDLMAEQHNSDLAPEALIKHIEEMKTGQLICFSCLAGAILGKATTEQTQALHRYARNIGIAFQIADDILDVTGNQELMGKKLHKDDSEGKVTFVSLYGLTKARRIAEDLIADAKAALKIFGDKAALLQDLAQFIIDRDH